MLPLPEIIVESLTSRLQDKYSKADLNYSIAYCYFTTVCTLTVPVQSLDKGGGRR